MVRISLPNHFGSYSAVSASRLSGCLLVLFSFYLFITPLSEVLRRNMRLPLKSWSLQGKYVSALMSSKSRLGNHIFEYAGLLGIAKTIGRTPVIYLDNIFYLKMLEETNKTIPGLIDQFVIKYEEFPKSVEVTPFNTRCCVWQDPAVVNSIHDDLIILGGKFYQSHKYFPKMREKMIGYLATTENDFKNLPASTKYSFINCVHVRRGDFKRYDFHRSDANFIRKAVRYIENNVDLKNKSIYTVIFGDDMKFMDSLMTNDTDDTIGKRQDSFHFVSHNSPSDDLVYAKLHCDSVFISAAHSTFGWWMGYFSKGDNVYYTDIRATNDSRYLQGHVNPVDYYLPHWKPLKYGDNFTIIESYQSFLENDLV